MKNTKNLSPAHIISDRQKSIEAANTLIVALRNPLRQKILKLILAKPNMPVNEIIHKTQGEQSIISQHLGILRQAELVTFIRKGKSIMYTANLRRLKVVLNRIDGLIA